MVVFFEHRPVDPVDDEIPVGLHVQNGADSGLLQALNINSTARAGADENAVGYQIEVNH